MSDDKSTGHAAQLARIRALLAKTRPDSGCTEAEAKAAAAKVDQLLQAYEIDMDEVTARQQEVVQLQVAVGDHVVRVCGRRIGEFTDCKVWTVAGEDLIFLGFKVDTEIAEYLVMVFVRAMDSESTQFTMFNPEYELAKPHGRREMLRSFQVGMATRLGERLGELKSKRDFTVVRSSGRDLVAIKRPMVEAAFAELGITLGRGTATAARDKAAYTAGRGAAEGVALNQGITMKRANIGGRIR